jgi:predicted nucleic acid-binding Zn ribbon protein
MQKMSEDPLQNCPECDEKGLVKKVSAAGFRLKGSGWYETDFKSGNKRNVWGDKDPGSSDSGGTKETSKTSSESTSSSSTSGDGGSNASSNASSSKSSDGGSSSGSKKSD